VAKNRIHYLEDIQTLEPVISFQKDPDTGYYKKITQHVVRSHRANTVATEKPVESEENYRLSSQDDYDYTIEYEDIDEARAFLYFKKIEGD
jgi:hypothetical protein